MDTNDKDISEKRRELDQLKAICSKNSGLNCSGGRSSKFCNSFSLVKGFTIVAQSYQLFNKQG